MTLTSSSSLLSTRRLVEADELTTPLQCQCYQWHTRAHRQCHARRRQKAHQQCHLCQRHVSLWVTCRSNSSTTTWVRMATSPLSATQRGADAAPVKQTAHTPTSPLSGGGCIKLAPHLHMVIWPQKFWPHLLEKYNGSVNAAEFLQIYTTSILIAGWIEAVVVNYLPMTLIGMAQSWLMNLP
jgi:hypothetical protein